MLVPHPPLRQDGVMAASLLFSLLLLAPPALADEPPLPVRYDRYGDPLPPGVVARMGSGRWRVPGFPLGLTISPDGRFIAAPGKHGVQVIDAETGIVRHSFSEGPHTFIFSPDSRSLVVLGGTMNMFCRRYDVETGEELHQAEWHDEKYPLAPVISPDGTHAAVGRNDDSITIYDTTTGQAGARFTSERARWLAFAPHGRTLAVCNFGETVRLYDVRTGKEVQSLTRSGDLIFRITYSPDGRFLASMSAFDHPRYGEVSIWELASGKELQRLNGMWHFEYCTVFSPDGRLLVTTSIRGGYLLLWDTATGEEIGRFPAQTPVTMAAFAPDGRSLFVFYGGGVLARFEVPSGRPLTGSEFLTGIALALRYVDGARRLLSTGTPIIAWDPVTGREVHRFPLAHGARPPVALSPDESLIAYCEFDNPIRLRSATTGDVVAAWEVGSPSTLAFQFTPDGRRAITRSYDQPPIVWDVASGERLHQLGIAARPSSFLAISPDGGTVALTGESNLGGQTGHSAHLWDLESGRELRRLGPGRSEPGHLTFSPDGRRLAVCSAVHRAPQPRGELTIWEVATGKELLSITADKEWVHNSTFSPDSRMVASSGDDCSLRVWEIASGRQRLEFHGHGGRITALAFAPDGRTLAAASPDAPIFIWDIIGVLQPRRKLSADDLEKCWTELAGEDAEAAFRAIRRLVADPERAVPFLRERLKPVPVPAAKTVRQLLDELASPTFAVREKAAAELGKLGDAIGETLRQELTATTSAAVRRQLEELIRRQEALGPEQLRAIRAVEVLEWMGSKEAAELVKEWSKGAPGARLTREAGETAQRILGPR